MQNIRRMDLAFYFMFGICTSLLLSALYIISMQIEHEKELDYLVKKTQEQFFTIQELNHELNICYFEQELYLDQCETGYCSKIEVIRK